MGGGQRSIRISPLCNYGEVQFQGRVLKIPLPYLFTYEHNSQDKITSERVSSLSLWPTPQITGINALKVF